MCDFQVRIRIILSAGFNVDEEIGQYSQSATIETILEVSDDLSKFLEWAENKTRDQF